MCGTKASIILGSLIMGRDRIVIQAQDIKRPPRQLVEELKHIGTASATSILSRFCGIRNAHILGPRPFTPRVALAGPALTLQFLPLREDLYGADEYGDPEKQLHRHVLYHTQPGDIVVVDARGDMQSGIFGNMMMTYFRGRGGAGVVIDGCMRDWNGSKDLGLGFWLRGITPNFHTQVSIFPYAVNQTIAMNNVTVVPGDIIVADDDGVVVVPAALAEKVIAHSKVHHEWEEFSRIRLSEGGDLRRYYPLSDDARPEYEAWLAAQKSK
jgi:regulator of RNase E activity RraA